MADVSKYLAEKHQGFIDRLETFWRDVFFDYKVKKKTFFGILQKKIKKNHFLGFCKKKLLEYCFDGGIQKLFSKKTGAERGKRF